MKTPSEIPGQRLSGVWASRMSPFQKQPVRRIGRTKTRWKSQRLSDIEKNSSNQESCLF
ncbi:hypothetical protein [Neisseria polysaccharea]|uniref:hypothetical protein n=1 Tax=Neisseria polysaccharea TaxID=489 RepID=UPI001478F66B